jgi:hypothetical protein
LPRSEQSSWIDLREAGKAVAVTECEVNTHVVAWVRNDPSIIVYGDEIVPNCTSALFPLHSALIGDAFEDSSGGGSAQAAVNPGGISLYSSAHGRNWAGGYGEASGEIVTDDLLLGACDCPQFEFRASMTMFIDIDVRLAIPDVDEFGDADVTFNFSAEISSANSVDGASGFIKIRDADYLPDPDVTLDGVFEEPQNSGLVTVFGNTVEVHGTISFLVYFDANNMHEFELFAEIASDAEDSIATGDASSTISLPIGGPLFDTTELGDDWVNSPSLNLVNNQWLGSPPTIPEPTTALLFAFGLVGLAAAQRRRVN